MLVQRRARSVPSCATVTADDRNEKRFAACDARARCHARAHGRARGILPGVRWTMET